MTQFFDSRGQTVHTGRQLGTGGEGAVFEISGDSHYVAKIYHRPVEADKAEKLRLMASQASDEMTKFAALPVATLSTNRNGSVSGFVMPRVTGHSEIHTLYSPAQRKLRFPDKDWGFLIHVAMNCAASFDALHRKSLVIGDVNQGNVLVSSQGTVFLIDCDSFQLISGGRLYPCEVGVPHFTPPELQGQSFRRMRRTSNHDLFGLAVLVFHLLCMGRHPYAGRFLGTGEVPIEKAITEFRYAYSSSSAILQMSPPPQTLDLRSVIPSVAGLFERAFLKGSAAPSARPTAHEWYCALQNLGSGLISCTLDVGHKYPKSLSSCPWCGLQRDGAPNFFISVSVKAFSPGEMSPNFDVQTIWSQILSVPRPLRFVASQLPSVNQFHVVANQLPVEIQQYIGFTRLIGQIAVSCFLGCMSFIFTSLAGGFFSFVFVIFGVWWIALQFTTGIASERKRRQDNLKNAETGFSRLKQEVALKLNKISEEFDVTFNVSIGA